MKRQRAQPIVTTYNWLLVAFSLYAWCVVWVFWGKVRSPPRTTAWLRSLMIKLGSQQSVKGKRFDSIHIFYCLFWLWGLFFLCSICEYIIKLKALLSNSLQHFIFMYLLFLRTATIIVWHWPTCYYSLRCSHSDDQLNHISFWLTGTLSAQACYPVSGLLSASSMFKLVEFWWD